MIMNIKDMLLDSDRLKRKQHTISQLYTLRSQYEPTWKMLSRYINPTRGRFEVDIQSTEGHRRDEYLIDPHPQKAVGKCAAGIHSGLTSPSRPWFELGLQDEEKANYHTVRMWLDDCQEIMSSIYSKSNAYNMLQQIEAEMAQFGTGASLMLEDYNYGIWMRPYTCGEYAGGVDARGRVYVFARRFRLSAEQIVKEYGIDNVSESVKSAYKEGNITTYFDVEMLIERNDDYDPNKLALGNFPWRSYHYEKGANDKFLKISGFRECPFLMPRWTLIANSVYGAGPGHNALGDCMQLQKIEKNKLRAIDNAADPAMAFPASMKKLNRMPGGLNYYPDGLAQQAYPLVDPRAKAYEGIGALSQEKRQSISETFYNDLFMMIASQDGTQMTAREIAERHEEKLLMLSPVLEQMHNEVLEPMTLRTFDICLRHGLFPPMPEEIDKNELKVSFISILAQAQKMVEIPAIERTVGFVGNLAAAQPEVLDIIDLDEAVRGFATSTGVKEKIVRDENEVANIRKQRAQAQQEQMQTEQMAAAAPAVRDYADAARLMSETPANGGNALDQLLGGGI